VGLGKIFLDIGQYEKAIQTFAAVIQEDNSYFAAYVGLGEALLHEKDYDQSVEALNGALTLIPHHPKADEILDIAREKAVEKHLELGKKKYSLGNFDGGKEEFEKVLKLHPQNTIARLQMADILEREENLQAAEEHLNKLLAEDNTNTDALRLLGKILSRTKRLEEAQTAFQRLLEINPLDQEGRTSLQAVQKALFSDPNIPSAFFELSSSMRTTRGELAAILSLGLKSIEPKSADNDLSIRDIDKHWARKHIVRAVQMDFTHVKSGSSFAPNDPVTRGELASIVYRIITRYGSIEKDQTTTRYTPYQDITPDHHLYPAVLYLYQTRIMVGEEKHYFGVKSQVPGIEALEVVDRLEEHLPKIKK
jgi:tetratricopeptide (TPR) repeat protein